MIVSTMVKLIGWEQIQNKETGELKGYNISYAMDKPLQDEFSKGVDVGSAYLGMGKDKPQKELEYDPKAKYMLYFRQSEFNGQLKQFASHCEKI